MPPTLSDLTTCRCAHVGQAVMTSASSLPIHRGCQIYHGLVIREILSVFAILPAIWARNRGVMRQSGLFSRTTPMRSETVRSIQRTRSSVTHDSVMSDAAIHRPDRDGAARPRAHAARSLQPWKWGWPNDQCSHLVFVVSPTARTPQYTPLSSRGRRCWPLRPRTRGCSRHWQSPSARSQRDARWGCSPSPPLAH
jgi:hypothetical protein